MKHNQPPDDRWPDAGLMDLLEEWQPEVEPSPEFDRRLRLRIAAAAPAPRPWWSLQLQWVAAAALLAVVAGVGLYFRGAPKAPASAPVIEARVESPMRPAADAASDPMTRDLQTLSRDGDLLDHLDFLSATAGSTRVQDRD